MWVFSLGPAPTLMNKPLLYKAPYAWLMLVPGVEGVRVPARFWVLATLCLAVAGALALGYIVERWPTLRRPLVAVVAVLLLVEAWPTALPLLEPPAWRPSNTSAVSRLELPTGSDPGSLRALSRDTAPPPAGERIQRLLRAALRGAAGVAGPEEPGRAWPAGVLW